MIDGTGCCNTSLAFIDRSGPGSMGHWLPLSRAHAASLSSPASQDSTDDFVSVDEALAAAPRQADGSLPDVGFMQLATGSDLIDAGTDVGLPCNGSAPDLVAFEN